MITALSVNYLLVFKQNLIFDSQAKQAASINIEFSLEYLILDIEKMLLAIS